MSPDTAVPPVATRSQAARRPPMLSVTTILVGLNVLVFVAMVATGASITSPTLDQLRIWGAEWGPLSLVSQPWRILTSNYVHIGIIHIFFNMWCLWNLGQLTERIFDRWTYILAYTACGIGGSLASLSWHPFVVGAGASGAIFGLAGLMITVFYFGKLPIPKSALRPTLRSLISFAGYNLLFGLVPGIDNSAHIGGLVTGLCLGAAFAKLTTLPMEARRSLRWLIFAVTAVVFAGSFFLIQKHHADVVELGRGQDQVALFRGIHGLGKNSDEGLADLGKFGQENSHSSEIQSFLGQVYLETHHPDEAIIAFKNSLNIKPDADVEMLLANAYQDKGMTQEANDAVHKAKQLEHEK